MQDDAFRVVRLLPETHELAAEQWALYEASLQALVELYLQGLQHTGSGAASLEQAMANVAAHRPYVWLGLIGKRVVVAAHLSEVLPKATAAIHGLCLPGFRRHAVKAALWQSLLGTAFGSELKLGKLKAVFEGGNLGAKGFCLLHGFSKEAELPRELLKPDGSWASLQHWALYPLLPSP
jgi:hypothetical protein